MPKISDHFSFLPFLLCLFCVCANALRVLQQREEALASKEAALQQQKKQYEQLEQLSQQWGQQQEQREDMVAALQHMAAAKQKEAALQHPPQHRIVAVLLRQMQMADQVRQFGRRCREQACQFSRHSCHARSSVQNAPHCLAEMLTAN